MSYKSKNKALRIISWVLAVLLLFTAGAVVVSYFSDGFKNWDKFKTDKNEEAVAFDENGNSLNGDKVYNMPRNLAFRSASTLSAGEYDEVTLKATVKPDNATYKEVDWSIAWDQEEVDKQEDIWNSWWNVEGCMYEITDYITITPTTDGSATATVKCLKPFGVPAIITVTSRNNPNAKATCRVDFVKRIVSAEFAFSDVNDDDNNLFVIPGNFAESGTNIIEVEETVLPVSDAMPDYMHLNPQGLEWQKGNEGGGNDTIQDYKHIVYTAYTIDDFVDGPVITARPTQEFLAFISDSGYGDFNNFFEEYEDYGGVLPVIEEGTQIPLKMDSITFLLTQEYLDSQGVNDDTLNDLIEYVRGGDTMPFMEILVSFEGTYNTYTQSFTLVYESDHFSEFQIRVKTVEIDNSQVII